jgi:CheY-like chemotaxis protein
MAKLRHAVINIVNNAGKFTRGGTVTLMARVIDDLVEIAVRDTGVGIRRENLTNLFQNFGESQGATASKYGGTGLGLALSQKLCRLMGGDIAVESELGKGSCFTIRVPTTLPAAAPPADEDADSDDPTSGANRDAVLIIDSDREDADHLRQLLAEEGYQPVTARTAADALALAEASKPGVILLGALSPESDGWVVLQGIKANRDLRTCPVILLTAQQDTAKGRAFGASAHVIKPVDREQLLRALRSVRTHADQHEFGSINLDRAAS